jgi:hypothetical protein
MELDKRNVHGAMEQVETAIIFNAITVVELGRSNVHGVLELEKRATLAINVMEKDFLFANLVVKVVKSCVMLAMETVEEQVAPFTPDIGSNFVFPSIVLTVIVGVIFLLFLASRRKKFEN